MLFPVDKFASLRTPFYYYDTELLQQTLDVIAAQLRRRPNYRMHYAIKANANPRLLHMISAMGFGADCVSGGEVRVAAENGFAPADIFYAGVGKSDWEIEMALDLGIGCFNVESLAELRVISEIAQRKGVTAHVALRVNPDIGAHTHSNITTGLAENKFGINLEQLEDVLNEALHLPGISYYGLHFHIGSQITDMLDFCALCNRINDISQQLQKHDLPVGDINVGGGLGVDYQHPDKAPMADFESYFDVFRQHLELVPNQTLHFELGRSIVAPCGSLVSRILYVKEGTVKRFAIVDGSMTELIRPALYHAFHYPQNISAEQEAQQNDGTVSIDRKPLTYDLVGPVCESSDVFAKAIDLPACHRGDFIALRTAGAYGETMSSGYNTRPLPQSYFSSDLF